MAKVIPFLALSILLGINSAIANPWTIPLPHFPGISSPNWVLVRDNASDLTLHLDGVERPIHGQWQSRQPWGNGFRASNLIFKLRLGDLPPTDIRLSTITLNREPVGWHLAIGSIELGRPHYLIEISDLSWRWDNQGNWQIQLGSIRLQVPLQIPIEGSRNTTWRLLELVTDGIAGQGNRTGWQGEIGLTKLAVPVQVQGSDTSPPSRNGQGRVDPIQMVVAADGRFSVANPGGQVDRLLAFWLLGMDIGRDLRMGPLGIEGLANSGGVQLRSRNLLPWLDLWFGEPGAATRHLGAVRIGEDYIIALDN